MSREPTRPRAFAAMSDDSGPRPATLLSAGAEGLGSRARRRTDAVLRRLNGIAPLSKVETRLVENCANRVQEHRPGKTVVEEGGAHKPTIILTGWACRQRVLADGRRQIVELLVPGDTPGFCPTPEPRITALCALTRLETADATSLMAAAQDRTGHPALGHILTASGVEGQSRLLNHIVRLGRHTAYERVANLLVETSARLAAVGSGNGEGRVYPFPLTQQILADLLGLSIVHMNRTLQQLRRDRLIELRAGSLVVLDAAGLTAAARINESITS